MNNEKFEETKKDIRSILLTHQKGCTIKELKKDYKQFIFKAWPAAEFGFSSDSAFLKTMPDVVHMTPYGNGEYLLVGIADEKSQHIQKMVSRQKPPKHKPPRLTSSLRTQKTYERYTYEKYSPAPRFQMLPMKKGLSSALKSDVIDLVRKYPSGLNVRSLEPYFEKYYRRKFSFREAGFATLQECIETIPELTLKNDGHNNIFIYMMNTVPKSSGAANSYLTGQDHSSVGKVMVNNHALTGTTDDFQHNVTFGNARTPLNSKSFNSSSLRPTATVFQPNLTKENAPPPLNTKLTSSNLHLHNSTVVPQPKPRQKIFEFLGKSQIGVLEPVPSLASYSSPNPQNSQSHVSDKYEPTEIHPPRNSSGGSFNPPNTADFNFHSQNHTTPKQKSGEVLKEEPYQSSFKVDSLDSFSLVDIGREEESDVPKNIRNNVKKVMEMYPQGIWAVDFPSIYEDATKMPLNLHSLGFQDLAGFVDSLPDIVKRETVDGILKDWIIYSVDTIREEEKSTDTLVPKSRVLLIEFIIQHIKKILQAYPEGVKLSEFLHVYSINCSEPLCIQNLGFDSIENFLISIAARVPLKFKSTGDCKTIHLAQYTEMNTSPIAHNESIITNHIPSDAAPPGTQIDTLKLPSTFDYSSYFPVYTSSIESPWLLYIQLEGSEYSSALNQIYDDIEAFYHGSESSSYRMKDSDIRVGAVCVALWPADNHWYRVKILSIPALDRVQVFYFDYGTKEEIPTTMLRYIRQKYISLPAQALTSCLAYLKPPLQAQEWSRQVRKRMLQLCQDKALMAKIVGIGKDGMLSLILCDTNKEPEVFINDVLLEEKLAECISQDESPLVPPTTQTSAQPAITPLHLLLQACATVSAMPANDLAKLVQSLSLLQLSSSNAPNPVLPQATVPISPPNITNFPSTSFAAGSFPQYQMDRQSTSLISQTLPSSSISAHNNSYTMQPFAVKQETVNNNSYLQNPLVPQVSSSVLNNPYAIEPFTTKQVASNSFLPKPLVPQTSSHLYRNPAEPIPGLGAPSNAEHASSSESEVFGDDDDEIFDQIYQEVASVMKRYVKRIRSNDGYIFHVIIIEGMPFVSSGDISVLIWNTQEPNYLQLRLQNREQLQKELPSQTLSEEGNENMFYQIRRFHVKGCHKVNDVSCILVYPLKSVIKILNDFGQPSTELRSKIINEISSFDAHRPMWQEISEAEFPEEEEAMSMGTDDDKLNRLCLYDLIAMKESIRVKRLQRLKTLEGPGGRVEEVEKLECLLKKVMERIQQIRQICTMFT